MEVFIVEKNISFKQGEEKREELELPTLHFVVMDQWLDVIGEKALLAWLKFYTWCDRDRNKGDKPVDINLWEQSKVPYSFKQMIKKLGVGRNTFYNQIIKPLWNVGLIDIEEYGDSKNTGQKPMNIIVYKYPQNNKSLSFSKIEIIRNYDTDYSSTAKSFAIKGGRPKKEKDTDDKDSEKPVDSVDSVDNQESEGGFLSKQGGFSLETGGVSSENREGFSLETGGGSQIGDNNNLNSSSNIFNTSNNSLNNLNNPDNDINNYFNSSSSKESNGNEEYFLTDIKEEEEVNEINHHVIDYLKNDLKYSDYIVTDIIKHMKINKIDSFTKKQMLNQARRILIWINENKKEIREFGYFFVNGILKHEPSRKVIDHENEMRRLERERKEKREKEQFINLFFELEGRYPTNEEIETRDMTKYKRRTLFYNWLEN